MRNDSQKKVQLSPPWLIQSSTNAADAINLLDYCFFVSLIIEYNRESRRAKAKTGHVTETCSWFRSWPLAERIILPFSTHSLCLILKMIVPSVSSVRNASISILMILSAVMLASAAEATKTGKDLVSTDFTSTIASGMW